MSTRSARAVATAGPLLSVGLAPPVLFSDRGCPFAHRVLALLGHLGAPVERRESPVGEKPDGLEQHSAAGYLPLLVHGDLVLTESRVMLEHLAEHHGYTDAYPADLAARSLHRHALAVVDRTLVPLLFGRKHAEPGDPRLEDGLAALAAATATVEPRPSLLALHVAPMWLRFRWWQPASVVTRAIEARTSLAVWLDATIELACVTRTAPDRIAHLEDLSRARQAGLLGPSKT